MIAIILVLFVVIMGFVVIQTMDLHEDWLIIYKCSIIFLAAAFLAFYTPYKVNEFSCKEKATAQGLDYKFGLFEGCLVKEKEGNYIDYDKYRVVK